MFYGDEAEGGEIVSCASEVGVFASRRLVIVKAADRLPAKQSEALLPYIKDPNESTTMVFVAAKLDGKDSKYGFRMFKYAWDAKPGTYKIGSRATDRAGAVQPEIPIWNPSGYLYNAIDIASVGVKA